MNESDWSSQAVSTSLSGWSTSLLSNQPGLTSEVCSESITALFHSFPNVLSVAVEASSHPSGLESLYAQPYVYAGSLGNLDECPLQSCIAGNTRHDSLTFASVCIPHQCRAEDLAADDFVAALQRSAQGFDTSGSILPIDSSSPSSESQAMLIRDYIALHDRIAQLNKFLHTGWTCGNFVVPWNWSTTIPYIAIVGIFVLLTAASSWRKRRRKAWRQARSFHSLKEDYGEPQNNNEFSSLLKVVPREVSGNAAEERCMVDLSAQCYPFFGSRGSAPSDSKMSRVTSVSSTTAMTPSDGRSTPLSRFEETSSLASGSSQESELETDAIPSLHTTNLFDCFDLSKHIAHLQQRPDEATACLDGLRVGSIFWIVFGHVLAIVSSTGPGYSNPAVFLPPTGWTTTLAGQMVFSSRLAVDTFFCISGYLAVHVLKKKFPRLQPNEQQRGSNDMWLCVSVVRTYASWFPKLLLARLVRILPLYVITLGFYTQIAPHLGEGPFWYQWLGLLKPCHDYWWSNLLFINNFVPFDTATTETCFYHSWYLAVDMQLFLLLTPLIVLYRKSPARGRLATLGLWILSVIWTTYLTFARGWSLNTFDGAAVARFDMEAYAKPHIRAQSYLAGMLCCMILPSRILRNRVPFSCRHYIVLIATLATMAIVTFVTVTGAYARRPCQYEEWPQFSQCGSTWPPVFTYMYTAWSRTLWTCGVAVVMHLCIGRTHLLATILSWKCWTPLSHLSFGVYLVHPILLFVWQMGNREKTVFRTLTVGMDYLSVCVVSYVFALLAALFVEFPCAALWKASVSKQETSDSDEISLHAPNNDSLVQKKEASYGSLEVQKV